MNLLLNFKTLFTQNFPVERILSFSVKKYHLKVSGVTPKKVAHDSLETNYQIKKKLKISMIIKLM